MPTYIPTYMHTVDPGETRPEPHVQFAKTETATLGVQSPARGSFKGFGLRV